MFITIQELNTHAYAEVIDEITRFDEDVATTAIIAATEEARGYLTNFDTVATFAATGIDRNPILAMYIKDIALWHLINLGNPGIDYEHRKDRYDKAIKWLEKVQSGKTNPMLPLPAAPVNEYGNVENFLKWGSNCSAVTATINPSLRGTKQSVFLTSII